MECFFREPDAFVGFEIAALTGEGGMPKFFLLLQVTFKQLFLGFENAAGKLRQPLNTFLVDMGFEAEVLGAQRVHLVHQFQNDLPFPAYTYRFSRWCCKETVRESVQTVISEIIAK